MTIDEAITTEIEYSQPCDIICKDGADCNDCRSYHRQLVEWLEELKQYRAIGTPEELQTMKEHGGFTGVELANIAAMQMKLKEYEAIGAPGECRVAVEKQKAKKPVTYKGTNIADCPICGATVRGISKHFGDWCSHCGHKLDWSDKK